MSKKVSAVELEDVVIRFSGDSGDGMQLSGTLFSETSALFGNDVATFPDYPAEIRAPQGTVGGVSGFQVHIGHKKINTPGDYVDVLVAMNPAALKAHSKWVKLGGTIICDTDSFDEKNLKKAELDDNPLTDGSYDGYHLIKSPITSMTREAVKELGMDNKTANRSKNMFALGMVYWMFGRPLDYTEAFFESKFKKDPKVVEANKRVLDAGFNYAETIHVMTPYVVRPSEIIKGKYRNVNGNVATAWGFLAAAEKSGLGLFCGSYPITPATEILQEIAKRKDLGAIVVQAEDEIAGICTAIGASFAGKLAVTTTSGPGLALKTEASGLAVIMELPLVIVDVQRGGPSTGLPTKTEQADLFQALYGRNGESPVVVIAASSPSDCFDYAFYAAKIALEHMTPVILLTDSYLANGTEPWKIPNMKDYPKINPPVIKECDGNYLPYKRDEKLVRTWAHPGTKGLEHRIGSLEKMTDTGAVSYVPENHEVMTNIREKKVNLVANDIPELEIIGDSNADLLVVGWGSTYGQLLSAVEELQKENKSISLVQFNYIRPLPRNTEDVLKGHKKIVVCELNLGQFANYLRINHQQFNYLQYNKVQGLPFTIVELKDHFNKLLEDI